MEWNEILHKRRFWEWKLNSAKGKELKRKRWTIRLTIEYMNEYRVLLRLSNGACVVAGVCIVDFGNQECWVRSDLHQVSFDATWKREKQKCCWMRSTQGWCQCHSCDEFATVIVPLCITPLFPSWHILIEFPRRNQNFLTLFRLVSRHNSISCCCCASRTPPMTSSKCVEQCTSIGSLSRLRNIYRGVECPVHQQFELSALERKKAKRIIALAFTRALGHIFHSVQSLFIAGDGQWL